MNNLNVYGGLTAINDFLNPENHLTPLVELPSSLNPFLADGIHIYIKMQTFLPLMNVKSVPAYEMLKNDVQPFFRKYGIFIVRLEPLFWL